MRHFLLVSLLLVGCAKDPDQASCKANSGTTQMNNQTISLVNGTCSSTYTPGTLTVNSKSVSVMNATICGVNVGYIYNKILYNLNMTDANSPTGFVQYPDNYYIFPQGGANSTTQCWYKITSGSIDTTALPPTF